MGLKIATKVKPKKALNLTIKSKAKPTTKVKPKKSADLIDTYPLEKLVKGHVSLYLKLDMLMWSCIEMKRRSEMEKMSSYMHGVIKPVNEGNYQDELELLHDAWFNAVQTEDMTQVETLLDNTRAYYEKHKGNLNK